MRSCTKFIALINGAWGVLAQAADANSSIASRIALGEDVYSQSCEICHYDGAGNAAAPDLVGNPVWKGTPESVASIILKGQSGVSIVKGKKLNGVMPPMAFLSDEEIAAVTEYLFKTFGERVVQVDNGLVARLRAATEAPTPNPAATDARD